MLRDRFRSRSGTPKVPLVARLRAIWALNGQIDYRWIDRARCRLGSDLLWVDASPVHRRGGAGYL